MPDILDLDALAPQPRTIKFNGKNYKCLPLTIGQLVGIARLEERLTKIESLDEIEEIVKEALVPFIPELKDLKLDFTIEQMRAIIEFAQTSQVPQEAKQAQEFTPAKKNDSPKV